MDSKKYTGVVNDYQSFLSFLDTLALIISQMFGEHCEVVISDLDQPDESVISIYNGHVTSRKEGDPLTARAEELIERSKNGYNINYRKANKQNRKEIKSSTMLIKAFDRNLSFCINYDCDEIRALNSILNGFLTMSSEGYEEFDPSDGQVTIEDRIEREIEKMQKSVFDMDRLDRLCLVRRLKDAGIFKIQKSVPYVANRLGVTRHTIYNYLKET